MLNKKTLIEIGATTLLLSGVFLLIYGYSLIDPEFDWSEYLQMLAGGMIAVAIYTLIYLIQRKKKSVLIIYHQDDKELAIALSDYLSKNKTIVYEENKIVKFGDNINQALKGTIGMYDSFIVILSENLLLSDFLKKEIALAKEENKRIIPIIKDDTAMPSFLSDYKPANLKKSINGAFEFEPLLGSI